MAWAEVPGLCVPCYINASHCTYTAHNAPGGTGLTHPPIPSIHTYIHLLLSLFPLCVCLILSTSFVCMCVFVCVCSCRLIGDALCAICSNPPTHLPPFPLITRVGLTICVPVCSHSVKKEYFGGVVAVVTGVATTDTHTKMAHCYAVYGDKTEELIRHCPTT